MFPGTESLGSNNNGLLLLQPCAEHELLITNTAHRLPTRNRTSLMHSRSKHWHLIDYVIVRKRDMQDVRVTKSMCGVEYWTDHRFIVSKLNIRIHHERRPQGKKAPARLNITMLKNIITKQPFVDTLEKRLDSTPWIVRMWRQTGRPSEAGLQHHYRDRKTLLTKAKY